MEVIVPDPSKVYSPSGMVESKSVGTFSPFQRQDNHRGLFVDRGVGSPRLVKSASATNFTIGPKPNSAAKVCTNPPFFPLLKIVMKSFALSLMVFFIPLIFPLCNC